MRDYRAWHQEYDDPQSSLSQRLAVVQRRLDECLTARPPGRIGMISMCAGQGRDVIPVVRDHPRRADIDAVLLEIDDENVASARRAAASVGLDRLQVVQADASSSTVYAPFVPADVLLACGIFGNISNADLEGTVRNLSMLCRQGASVIWTRHWKEWEIIVKVRAWFRESGFEDLGYEALENDRKMGIGVALLKGPPVEFKPGYQFFTFLR